MADRHGPNSFLPKSLFEPAACRVGDLGIETDIEVRRADRREIGRRCPERGDEMNVDPERIEQAGHLDYVVAMAEAERGRPKQIGARAATFARCGPHIFVGEFADELIKGFARAPMLLAAVAG